jgi:hypothetical protein
MADNRTRTATEILADIASLGRAIIQNEEARRSGQPDAIGSLARRKMYERRFELLDELARLEG